MPPKSYSDGRLNSTISVRTEFLVGTRPQIGQFWAVLLQMKTVGSAPDEKSFYGAANRRDKCTMVSFSRSKRKFRLYRLRLGCAGLVAALFHSLRLAYRKP
jgi:hypothetical protein